MDILSRLKFVGAKSNYTYEDLLNKIKQLETKRDIAINKFYSRPSNKDLNWWEYNTSETKHIKRLIGQLEDLYKLLKSYE